jgi:hypothetical protein
LLVSLHAVDLGEPALLNRCVSGEVGDDGKTGVNRWLGENGDQSMRGRADTLARIQLRGTR